MPAACLLLAAYSGRDSAYLNACVPRLSKAPFGGGEDAAPAVAHRIPLDTRLGPCSRLAGLMLSGVFERKNADTMALSPCKPRRA